MKIRKIVAAAAAAVVATAAMTVSSFAAIAGITFQTSIYQYRDTLDQTDILVWDNDLGEGVEVEGASYKDATIDADGTYTVELTGDFGAGWNMIAINTDIKEADYPDVVLTLEKVEVDGAEISFDAEAAACGTYNGVYRIQLYNTYDKLEAIPNEEYDSVKATFTVTGFSAPADSTPADSTPADSTPADSTPADSTPASSTPDKGTPNTGVAGVAAVAGLAIVAAGAIVLSKKR